MKKDLAEKAAKRAGYRLKTAGTKLNTVELAALEKHCRDKGETPGELIRQLILTELGRVTTEAPASNPTLTEVLGVPSATGKCPAASGRRTETYTRTFDKLLDEISAAKYELAGKLASEKRR